MKKKSVAKKLLESAKRFKFTPRELETLTLLAIGEPWKSVAQQMFITIDTVNFHVRNILRKTGAASVLEAISKIFLD